jgi:nitronate monooxygenase
MWPRTNVSEILKIEYPILQAGMAGGITTPELVAAVSNAGGLGMLGAGYMTPEQIRDAIREIRDRTDRPFGINLFVPEQVSESPENIARMNKHLATYRQQLGLMSEPDITKYAESFEDQLAVVFEEHVPVFSFTFGIPSPNIIREIKNQGIVVVGTATTVREAVTLEQNGVDLIVAQGNEAGGHRGTFLGPWQESLVGLMALLPQMVDQVHVPVIAAGGIMDARAIVASLVLGASAVQMGTAFLTCTESGAHPCYKEALLASTDESTVITRAFSGKPARGIKNLFIVEMEQYTGEIPAYPIQNALTREIRQAAAKQNRTEWMSLWAGQASAMCKTQSATELMRDLVAEIDRILRAVGARRNQHE